MPDHEPAPPAKGGTAARDAGVQEIAALDLPLERDAFLRHLLRELSGTLEEVVGVEEAAGYISVVGAAMGEHISAQYRRALAVERLDRARLGAVLVDLKRRIHGDFRVVEESEEHIVLENAACPFGDYVEGRPSLCMMTSNVFGAIAAESLGHAAVRLDRTIAAGDGFCRVVVLLRPQEVAPPGVREYFCRDDVG